jgi:hypothetical protein
MGMALLDKAVRIMFLLALGKSLSFESPSSKLSRRGILCWDVYSGSPAVSPLSSFMKEANIHIINYEKAWEGKEKA